MAAGGIENEYGALLFFGPNESVFGDFHHIRFAGFRGVAGDVDLFRQQRELVDGGGPIKVASNQQRAAAFFFQAVRELGGGGGFTGTIEAANQDAGGRVEIERGLVTAKQFGKLVLKNFDDLFAGFDRFEDIFAESLFLDLGDEILGDAEFDIRFE